MEKPSKQHWYFGVLCEKCGGLFVLWTNRSRGKAHIGGKKLGLIEGICRNSKCRHVGQYPNQSIRRFEGRAEV
ncbi:MAG: hypothetical protein QGI13_02110 [Rhodospirillales bacterium]|jgi:hypothetical protein|nr:hypothetical protein [Rhodospirillales bacterium]